MPFVAPPCCRTPAAAVLHLPRSPRRVACYLHAAPFPTAAVVRLVALHQPMPLQVGIAQHLAYVGAKSAATKGKVDADLASGEPG